MSNLTKNQIEHHRANFEKIYQMPNYIFFNGIDYQLNQELVEPNDGVVVCWTPPREECQNYNISFRAWLSAIEHTPIHIPEFKNPASNLTRTFIIKEITEQGFKVKNATIKN